VQKYGNTSSASIPIALSEALQEKRLKSNNMVLFVAFGGGLNWGAMIAKWG
jgi:3-oxoacyl-[acyl-carrier-protein] synthase-3